MEEIKYLERNVVQQYNKKVNWKINENVNHFQVFLGGNRRMEEQGHLKTKKAFIHLSPLSQTTMEDDAFSWDTRQPGSSIGGRSSCRGGHVKIWYTGIKAIWKGNQFIKSPNHKAFSHTFSYENTPRLMRSKNFRYWLNSAYGQPFSQTILLSACGQCFFPKCCSIAIHAKWTGTYVYLCSSAGAKITSTHISKCINVQQLCSKLMIDYHPLLYKKLILHWFRTLSNTRLWQ